MKAILILLLFSNVEGETPVVYEPAPTYDTIKECVAAYDTVRDVPIPEKLTLRVMCVSEDEVKVLL